MNKHKFGLLLLFLIMLSSFSLASDFVFEAINITVLSGNAISYKHPTHGEVNRISLVIENPPIQKSVKVTIGYPANRQFLGFEGGIMPLKNQVLSSKTQYDNLKTLATLNSVETTKIFIDKNDENKYFYETFDVILSPQPINKSSKDQPIISTTLSGITTTKFGEHDKLYMWIEGSFAGGVGTAGDPFQIDDWEGLNAIRTDRDASYILINDLDKDTSGYNTYASRTANSKAGWDAIDDFLGVLDGDGFKIKDLFINRSTTSDQGLFGLTSTSGSYIVDVHIRNMTAIVGVSSGLLYGNTNAAVTIINCSVEGNISGGNSATYIAGIIGRTRKNTNIVTNSYFRGSIHFNNPTIYTGGVIGGALFGTYNNVYGVIDVYLVDGSTGLSFGGFVVADSTTVTSYVNNSYVVVDDKNNMGIRGFMFARNRAVVRDSFWDVNVSNTTTSAAGTGKTTIQMMNISTFNDWDIELIEDWEDEIWKIKDGEDYPRLFFETPNYGDVVSPKWSFNFTNSTEAGLSSLFSSYWVDNLELDYYKLVYCDEWTPFGCLSSANYSGSLSGQQDWVNLSFILSPNHQQYFSWYVIVNDTGGNHNITPEWVYMVNDTLFPKYSLNTSSLSVPTANLSVFWEDFGVLDEWFIFLCSDWNYTSNLCNIDWLNESDNFGASGWSNASFSIETDKIYAWCWNASDEANNKNSSCSNPSVFITGSPFTDFVPPKYSNIGISGAYNGMPITHYILWSDDLGLGGYDFSWCLDYSIIDDCNVAWLNDSRVSFSGFAAWSNITKVLPNNNKTYAWCVTGYDYAGNQNKSCSVYTSSVFVPDMPYNERGLTEFRSVEQALTFFFLFALWGVFYFFTLTLKGDRGGTIHFLNVCQVMFGFTAGLNVLPYSFIIGLTVLFVSAGTAVGLVVKDF